MPRKPKIKPRAAALAKANSPRRSKPNTAPRTARASQKTYYQCLACGAIADPMYGLGNDSWCPSCHTCGEVYCADGQLPDPWLYGRWVESEEQKKVVKKEIGRAHV